MTVLVIMTIAVIIAYALNRIYPALFPPQVKQLLTVALPCCVLAGYFAYAMFSMASYLSI